MAKDKKGHLKGSQSTIDPGSIVSVEFNGTTLDTNYDPLGKNKEMVDALIIIAKHVITSEGYTFSTDPKSNADFRLTSTYRTNSKAHLRGALDISAKNLTASQEEKNKVYAKVAAGISKHMDKEGLVFFESLSKLKDSSKQIDDLYQDGKFLKTYPPKDRSATADHLHLQPNTDVSVVRVFGTNGCLN